MSKFTLMPFPLNPLQGFLYNNKTPLSPSITTAFGFNYVMDMVDAAACGVGGGGSCLFPVVFFDGECESTMGDVMIHPATEFKDFQLMISRRIGISPHQLYIYIADINNPSNRVPVTGKLNFSLISREKGRFFLVVLKISRRLRGRRARGRKAISYPPTATTKKEPPANAMFLRRGDGNNLMETRVFSGLDELEKRVRDLNIEKEKYLVNLESADFRIAKESKGLICEECDNGKDNGFHCCVNDAVIFWFRSQAGPIARPGKGSGC